MWNVHIYDCDVSNPLVKFLASYSEALENFNDTRIKTATRYLSLCFCEEKKRDAIRSRCK